MISVSGLADGMITAMVFLQMWGSIMNAAVEPQKVSHTMVSQIDHQF